MKRQPPSKDNLPSGWSGSDWETAKEAIRGVIWQQAQSRRPITYKDLTEERALRRFRINHRSATLAALLNEVAAEEHARGGPWVTAYIVLSGTRSSSTGFFRLVPFSYWKGMTPEAFCEQQRRLTTAWVAKHPL